MSREAITSAKVKAAGPYSAAVRSGEWVYLSGQVPMDAEVGELVQGSIADQTRQIFANLKAVLDAAGLTPDDVVKCVVFLVDMDDFAEMNGVYGEQFSEPYPARSCIGVAALPLGARVEIEMVARQS